MTQSRGFSFQTGIGPITDNVINSVLDRLTGEDVKNKIADNVITPIKNIVIDKVKPYIYLMIFLGILLFVLLIAIFYFSWKNKKTLDILASKYSI